MYRFTRLLAILICLGSLLLPVSVHAANEYVTTLADLDKDEECNVLVIGNSYARDGQEYVGRVLKAAGYKNVAVALVEIPGATLYRMWSGVEDGVTKYMYRVSTASDKIPKFRRRTMEYIINDRRWDVVILQPKSCYGIYDLDYFFADVDENNRIVKETTEPESNPDTSSEEAETTPSESAMSPEESESEVEESETAVEAPEVVSEEPEVVSEEPEVVSKSRR